MDDEKPCGAHAEAIKTLKESDDRQWAAIDKLQNRLPLWATMLISILTFAIGFTLNYAVMAFRMINVTQAAGK